MRNIVYIFLLIFTLSCCSQKQKYQNTNIINDISLNRQTITKIFLPKDDIDYIVLELSEYDGFYKYNYKNIEFSISYYSKDNIENSVNDEPYDRINIENMQLFEKYYSGKINELPNPAWTHNVRFNNINGINYVDTFIFFAHDYMDMRRVLYLTTNNYYIMIRINISHEELEEIFWDIYNEAPEYFKESYIESIIGKKGHDFLGWDNENDGKIKFTNDLLEGRNKSDKANSWFNITEEILQKIKINDTIDPLRQ